MEDEAATARVERAFLSSLLLLGRDAVWGKVSHLVGPDTLATNEHRLIYAAIREVAKTADPDLALVVERLDADRKLERAGGAVYVASLLDAVPNVDNLVEYAKRIKARSVLRRASAR